MNLRIKLRKWGYLVTSSVLGTSFWSNGQWFIELTYFRILLCFRSKLISSIYGISMDWTILCSFRVYESTLPVRSFNSNFEASWAYMKLDIAQQSKAYYTLITNGNISYTNEWPEALISDLGNYFQISNKCIAFFMRCI